MTDEELIKQYRDQQAALNGGCSDGYCVIEKTVGMHTNGGCGCLHNLDFLGMQRVGVMLKAAQVMADRIEQLTNTHWQVEAMHQNALLHDALTRAETAEAKLAKAVEESHRWKMECEDFWRKREDAAEAKLARIAYRVDHITLDDAGKHLPDHPLDVWVLALNTAHRIVIEEMEKTE